MSPVKPDNSPETQIPESEAGENNLPDDNETSLSELADIIIDAGAEALSGAGESAPLSDIKIDDASFRDDVLADDTFVRLLKKWAAEEALSGGAGSKMPEGETGSVEVADMISADEPLVNEPSPELETA